MTWLRRQKQLAFRRIVRRHRRLRSRGLIWLA